jgi:hypothetical protein
MIDYKAIVKEMVDKRSIKSCTSLEYNGKWYLIEIHVEQGYRVNQRS